MKILPERTGRKSFRRLAGFTLFVKDFPFFSLPARWENEEEKTFKTITPVRFRKDFRFHPSRESFPVFSPLPARWDVCKDSPLGTTTKSENLSKRTARKGSGRIEDERKFPRFQG